MGILDDFGVLTEYHGNGSKSDKIPHILLHSGSGDKVIYILGYGDRTKWQKALGGQYGCLYIDEINTADMDFVREAAMRADYLMATLNPDDPALPVYKEYVNCSRPLPEWEDGTPEEILKELTEEPKPGWVHWFFSFADNPGLPKTKLQRIMENTPRGTKLWKNKIQGLRGKATGLVFPNFDRERNVVKKAYVKANMKTDVNPSGKIVFTKYVCSVDTAYSSKSPDTIAFIFQGITKDGRLFVLSEKVYNNADLSIPLAPSDTVRKLIAFLKDCEEDWGFTREVFIDSADQATITEARKYKRQNGLVYDFYESYKKVKIIDRIKLMLGWIQQGAYLVNEDCREHLRELDTYSWKEDKDEPEDGHDHTVNAGQYGWIPFRTMIGFGEAE